MKFVLRADNNDTIIDEEINFKSPLPVKSLLERIFKKQHGQLFNNIEMKGRNVQNLQTYQDIRTNFLTQAQHSFSFLVDEFGYNGPELKHSTQSNGTVIQDEVRYQNSVLDRDITIKNSYHPVDYGFEIKLNYILQPSRGDNIETDFIVLKEKQDIKQSYIPDIAVRFKQKYKHFITGKPL